MLPAFAKHIKDEELFRPEDKLLLALSGGADSTVLAHLLKRCNLNFSLAHCNFKLRGAESDGDELFCRELAQKLGVKIYTTHFDVESYCRQHKVSVQMAARNLRYNWFGQLLSENGFNFLLTAHHAGDSLETLFINLLRGTGINGLKGIPGKSGKTVRPLLPFLKTDILKYADDNGIVYRTDKSNDEEKYGRNRLRLSIIPALKKINPGLEKSLLNGIRNFKEESEIVNEFVADQLKRIATQQKGQTLLDKRLLKKEKHKRTILHYALEPMGFNDTQVSDIIEHISQDGLVGKAFLSAGHVLTIDRNYLIVKPISNAEFKPVSIPDLEGFKNLTIIRYQVVKKFVLPGKDEFIVDAERLIFPLTLRVPAKGDKFRPFGMKGFKLLSDFFKDEKLNKFEKENCKLLVNGNGEIMWVIGYRSDDRYKVNATEKKLIKLTIN